VKLFRTSALLVTTAVLGTGLTVVAGTATAAVTPVVTPALVGLHPISAVATSDGSGGVVTVRVVCPVETTGFSALQVRVGPQSNLDGGHSMPGKIFRCTGRAQKVAVVVTPGQAMLGYPGTVLVPGQAYPATVSMSTHDYETQNPLSVTPFGERTVTVKG
jgi:hypothetical protein